MPLEKTNIETTHKRIKNILSIPKCYEYSDLFEGRLKCNYNEVDICGIVVKHSTNAYQNLVFLTNLETMSINKSSVVCLSFPKNSDVNTKSNEQKNLKNILVIFFCHMDFSTLVTVICSKH